MIEVKLEQLMWDNRVRAREISKATGLDECTISNMKNNKNKNLNVNTLNKLCRYFNCRISDLLEYVPD
ncbi:MAG: helix-turn-helix transcriptional regulator [Heliobacteriaceae bacterium]|jgi:putative transcriptional regulator|nr:helix-turn-helix transcriptional regulator [Heliobacteriaceae bacterium]